MFVVMQDVFHLVEDPSYVLLSGWVMLTHLAASVVVYCADCTCVRVDCAGSICFVCAAADCLLPTEADELRLEVCYSRDLVEDV